MSTTASAWSASQTLVAEWNSPLANRLVSFQVWGENAVSRDCLRSCTSAQHVSVLKGPLAKTKAGGSSDRQLLAVYNVGSLVCGRSSHLHGDELLSWGMASPKAFRVRPLDRS